MRAKSQQRDKVATSFKLTQQPAWHAEVATERELKDDASYHFRGNDERQHGVNLSLGWDW